MPATAAAAAAAAATESPPQLTSHPTSSPSTSKPTSRTNSNSKPKAKTNSRPRPRPRPPKPSSRSATAATTPRLTCVHCRTRKMRCDGGLPGCGICAAYGKDCSYEKPPSMARVVAMAGRIQELERTVRELRSSSSSQGMGPEEREEGERRAMPTPVLVPRQQTQPGAVSEVDEEEEEDQTMSLDRRDAYYYDSTSAVDGPRSVLLRSSADDEPRTTTPMATAVSESSFRSPHDLNYHHHQRPDSFHRHHHQLTEPNWEENAVANCAMFLHLPPEKVRHLLATHWAWVHPTFQFVDRRLFLRDAAAGGGGEYFSPLLLTVLCLHSTRFTDRDLAERLFAYAKLLVGREIHESAPTIPRVQAFLQLSAREIGRGSLSQAWLYSGIAFRMALDMGLFATATARRSAIRERKGEEEDTSPEGVERARVGHKLAWSCYLWDKTMSLYLGRNPSLQHEPAPWLAPDGNDDNGPSESYRHEYEWSPYGVPASSPMLQTTPSRTEACFQNFCRLGVIINDILLNLYGHQQQQYHSTQDVGHFVRNTRDRLEAWYRDLPDDLRMDGTPLVCPSPQILTQNLLYHATTILLLRPFRKVDACRQGCRDAANAIENLFLCMERTFGFTRVTYLMAYCAYIAATVAVQDARDRVPGAHRRVDTLVRVLEALCYSCPGIQRSLEIVRQSLVLPLPPLPPPMTISEVEEPRSEPVTVAAVPAAPAAAPEPVVFGSGFDVFDNMPTFPLNGPSFGMNPSAATMAMPYTELDPFTYQWSDFQGNMLDGMGFQI